MRLLLYPAHISGRERRGAAHLGLLRSELRQAGRTLVGGRRSAGAGGGCRSAKLHGKCSFSLTGSRVEVLQVTFFCVSNELNFIASQAEIQVSMARDDGKCCSS